MPLFYSSIILAILASAFYHFVAKSTPAGVNFTVSLLATYGLAFLMTLFTFFFFPAADGVLAELKKLNWASFALAFAIMGIEFGYLLMYRAGWDLGIAAVLVTTLAGLLLVPAAIFIFKDKISLINILGILICLAGLVMLNWKK